MSDLFGFADKESLDLFELLLTVSGVGPKVALLLVSALGQNVLSAIAKNDISVFKAVPGVGAKLAAKIVVELRGKVVAGKAGEFIMPEEDETVEALASLGYAKKDILPYLQEVPQSAVTVQDKVKYLLKRLSKNGSSS